MPNKYHEYSSARSYVRPPKSPHPIWRGVGLVLIIIIPVISYAAADVLLRQNGIHNWFPLPVDLLAKPADFLYKFIQDPMINIKALFTVGFLFVFYALLTFISFLANSMFGDTPRKDPFYVPPVRRRRRRI